MKKKWLAMALCLTMTASILAGCSGGSDSSNDTSAPDTTESTADAGDEDADAGAATDSTAAGDGELITVGFSQVGAESDWRTANTASMEAAFTEENGYSLIFDDAQQDQSNQITAVRNFIQQEVDYIVIAPVTETGWDTVLQEAYDEGIPVIIVDREVEVSNDDLFTAWVGSDFEKEGVESANWLIEYLDKQGRSEEEINIVTLQGTIGSSAQIGRTQGFGSVLAEQDNWNMLEMQTGEFTQAKGQEVMESFLKSYDNIDVVVAENDNMAFGAIDAIQAAGKTSGPDGDIIIISFDAVKAAFEAMIDGNLNVAVECNPLHGPRVAEIIQKLEAGQEAGVDFDKKQYVEEGIYPAETAADMIDDREY